MAGLIVASSDDPGDGERADREGTPDVDGRRETQERIDASAPTVGPGSPAGPGAPAELPESIGSYRVFGRLGVGGMGVVFEAEQQHPRRRVAVKVIRGGRYVDEHHSRLLEREAATLARLKHPNIAAIHESGRTSDGQQFFAMELVRGKALDAWVKARPAEPVGRELELRLELFRKIADAVHYAHQRGVIHRDLKPSNIVVTDASESSSEGEPEIKILDFGLARLMDAEADATTPPTEAGVLKGTLQYMSPEQAQGRPEEIDVRSDVYALGMILFEVLAGRRPYDVEGMTLRDALRLICEEPPPSLRDSSPGLRRIDPDVETILHKCLEKEADRRYGSAAALSEDIGRYLTSQPILARPPSTMYQIRKLVERNKLPAAFAATMLALLIGFGAWMALLYRQADANLARALDAETSATQVSDFMVGLFEVFDPSATRGNTITAREILDEGTRQIETELADRPEVQGRLKLTMGTIYYNLGLIEPGESLLRESVAIRRSMLGDDHPDTLTSMNKLGLVVQAAGRLDEAETYYREALADRRRVLGEDHIDTLESLHDLGFLLKAQGRLDEAEELYRQTLAGLRRTRPADDPRVLTVTSNLGVLLMERGRLDEAHELLTEVLEARLRILEADHPSTLGSMNNLGLLLKKQGRFEEAEAQYRRALEGIRRVLGDDHPATLTATHNLGQLQYDAGKLGEAEKNLRAAYEGRRRELGPDHESTHNSANRLASLLVNRGIALNGEGRFAQAESLLRECLEIRGATLAADHWLLANTRSILGESFVGQRRFDEAEPLLTAAGRFFDSHADAPAARRRDVFGRLVDLYERWGKPSAATDWRARLERLGPPPE